MIPYSVVGITGILLEDRLDFIGYPENCFSFILSLPALSPFSAAIIEIVPLP